MTLRSAGWGLMAFLALGVALYAAIAYSLLPLGAAVHPDMRAAFQAHPVGIGVHVFASVFALALGPFQFSARLRARRLNLHRWMGRLYLGLGVLVGGLAGLYLAQFAHGGLAGKLGFGTLAVLWLVTGERAFHFAHHGDVAAHRRWMYRNFSLAFAAVMLRLYLPAAVVAGADFAVAYAVIAWACWVPNLAFAEWLLRASLPRASPRTR
jgi:uncharacterized membrane protein